MPVTEDHMAYYYAAYKRGCFAHEITDGLSRDEFLENILGRINLLIQSGGDVTTLIGKTAYGMIPVGMVVHQSFQSNLWPHAVWFPEASSRNRIECVLKYIIALKEKSGVIIASSMGNVRYFDHLCKYGAIRRIGPSRSFYAPGEGAMLYEGVR